MVGVREMRELVLEEMWRCRQMEGTPASPVQATGATGAQMPSPLPSPPLPPTKAASAALGSGEPTYRSVMPPSNLFGAQAEAPSAAAPMASESNGTKHGGKWFSSLLRAAEQHAA